MASWLDKLQTGLDVVGMTPLVGNLVDLGNAGISLFRGDTTAAALRGAAAIPGLGQAVTVGKAGLAGTKGVKLLQKPSAAMDAARSAGARRTGATITGEGVEGAVRNQRGNFGQMGEGAFGRAGASTKPPRPRPKRSRRTTGGRRMRPLSQTNPRLLRETDDVVTRRGRINRILQGKRMPIPAQVGVKGTAALGFTGTGGESGAEMSKDATGLGIIPDRPATLQERIDAIKGIRKASRPRKSADRADLKKERDMLKRMLPNLEEKAFEEGQDEILSNIEKRRELGQLIIDRMTQPGRANPEYWSRNPAERKKLLDIGKTLGDASFSRADMERVIRGATKKAKEQVKLDKYAVDSAEGLAFVQQKIASDDERLRARSGEKPDALNQAILQQQRQGMVGDVGAGGLMGQEAAIEGTTKTTTARDELEKVEDDIEKKSIRLDADKEQFEKRRDKFDRKTNKLIKKEKEAERKRDLQDLAIKQRELEALKKENAKPFMTRFFGG